MDIRFPDFFGWSYDCIACDFLFEMGHNIPPEWIGLENYNELFVKDPLPLQSLRVTVTYSLMSLPIQIFLGLFLAMLLNNKIRGLSFFRTIYYLPAILSGVSVALLWRWIFQPEFGLLKHVPSFGRHSRPFLANGPRLGAGLLCNYEFLDGWGKYGNLPCWIARNPHRAL